MDDIVIEQVYPYAIEYVWEAITDPAALADWLMPGDFKPVVGHKLQMRCDPRPEFDGVVSIEILEADKPRRLSYSWKTSNMPKPTTVTFLLSPAMSGGTLLRLEHKGFDGEGGKIIHPLFKGGWAHKLKEQLSPVIARYVPKEAC